MTAASAASPAAFFLFVAFESRGTASVCASAVCLGPDNFGSGLLFGSSKDLFYTGWSFLFHRQSNVALCNSFVGHVNHLSVKPVVTRSDNVCTHAGIGAIYFFKCVILDFFFFSK